MSKKSKKKKVKTKDIWNLLFKIRHIPVDKSGLSLLEAHAYAEAHQYELIIEKKNGKIYPGVVGKMLLDSFQGKKEDYASLKNENFQLKMKIEEMSNKISFLEKKINKRA